MVLGGASVLASRGFKPGLFQFFDSSIPNLHVFIAAAEVLKSNMPFARPVLHWLRGSAD